MDSSRLILGAAQLGMDYGIANSSGRPGLPEAVSIVGMAAKSGVFRFDTAKVYGESEAVLGKGIQQYFNPPSLVEVTTKLTHTVLAQGMPGIRAALEDSIGKLGGGTLSCLMLHEEQDIALLDGEIGEVLLFLQQEEMFSHLDCSVYTPAGALDALNHPLVSVIQIPGSILDRRFEQNGIFSTAMRCGKTVQVRSVLLQGLLCLSPDTIPEYLHPLKLYVELFQQFSRENGLAFSAAALAWAAQHWPQARIIFGVDTKEQLRDNLSGFAHASDLDASIWHYLDNLIPPQCDALLNPSLWRI